MTEALKRAAKLWDDPKAVRAMLDQWDEDAYKLRYEQQVSAWVGEVGKIADLGCGSGRYARQLQCTEYYGYDGSVHMITAAKEKQSAGEFSHINVVEFSLADVLNYGSDRHYDVVLFLDVAQHQDEPAESVMIMLRNFSADRYIFSVLVGNVREDLLMMTVIPMSEFLDLLDNLDCTRFYVERYGNYKFARIVVECNGLR